VDKPQQVRFTLGIQVDLPVPEKEDRVDQTEGQLAAAIARPPASVL
jgi:hypothetical protein